MLKHLAVLSALVFGSVAIANATPITGFVNSNGVDSFTAPSPTVGSITFGASSVQGSLGGTFATYLVDGDAIVFPGGSLPYSQGANTAPTPNPLLFTITGTGGEKFAFNIASYVANYIASGAGGTSGCSSGASCLIATGTGMFTATGPGTFDPTPGAFTFTTQYPAGQKLGTVTSFSASASTSPVPEPASLALFGTGLLGIVEIGRRKLAA